MSETMVHVTPVAAEKLQAVLNERQAAGIRIYVEAG